MPEELDLGAVESFEQKLQEFVGGLPENEKPLMAALLAQAAEGAPDVEGYAYQSLCMLNLSPQLGRTLQVPVHQDGYQKFQQGGYEGTAGPTR